MHKVPHTPHQLARLKRNAREKKNNKLNVRCSMMMAAAAAANKKSIKFEMKIEQIVCLPIGIYIMLLLLTPPQANFSTHATNKRSDYSTVIIHLSVNFSSSSSIAIDIPVLSLLIAAYVLC